MFPETWQYPNKNVPFQAENHLGLRTQSLILAVLQATHLSIDYCSMLKEVSLAELESSPMYGYRNKYLQGSLIT